MGTGGLYRKKNRYVRKRTTGERYGRRRRARKKVRFVRGKRSRQHPGGDGAWIPLGGGRPTTAQEERPSLLGEARSASRKPAIPGIGVATRSCSKREKEDFPTYVGGHNGPPEEKMKRKKERGPTLGAWHGLLAEGEKKSLRERKRILSTEPPLDLGKGDDQFFQKSSAFTEAPRERKSDEDSMEGTSGTSERLTRPYDSKEKMECPNPVVWEQKITSTTWRRSFNSKAFFFKKGRLREKRK